MQKSSNIGGQAVMEGIMMRAGDRYSIGVRKPNGEIELTVRPYKSICPFFGVSKIPILRGVVSFIDSMAVGISSLTWSAEFAAEEEDEEEKKRERTEAEAKKEKRAWDLAMAGTVVFAIAFSVGLFILLPYFLAGLLRGAGVLEVWVSVAEAVLRVAIFLLYMFLISRMKDIQRVFACHGAEHKCINCVENGWDLTVENVRKASRRHKRCGTSFLLIVIVISVICFFFVGLFGIRTPLFRLLSRLLLIPLIAGIAFEFLKLAGSSENPLVCTLAKPGLALQGLVTREPDDSMIEVAIAAVNAVFDWRAWQGKPAEMPGDAASSEGNAAPPQGNAASLHGNAATPPGDATSSQGNTASPQGNAAPPEGAAQFRGERA